MITLTAAFPLIYNIVLAGATSRRNSRIIETTTLVRNPGTALTLYVTCKKKSPS